MKVLSGIGRCHLLVASTATLLLPPKSSSVVDGATLVVPGHEAVLAFEDDSPFEGTGVNGGTGGNQYYRSTSYFDPCDEYKGVKFPYTTLPEYGSDLLGFYVVTDCQVILCQKRRHRSTSSACSYDGCVSVSDSYTSGSNKIYDLIPKEGSNAEFLGAQTGDICKCVNYSDGQRFSMYNYNDKTYSETCYVSKLVVSLFDGYYTNCLRDDLDGLGKRAKVGGCKGVRSGKSANGVSGGATAAIVVIVLLVVGGASYFGYRRYKQNRQDSNTNEEVSTSNIKIKDDFDGEESSDKEDQPISSDDTKDVNDEGPSLMASLKTLMTSSFKKNADSGNGDTSKAETKAPSHDTDHSTTSHTGIDNDELEGEEASKTLRGSNPSKNDNMNYVVEEEGSHELVQNSSSLCGVSDCFSSPT